MVSSFSDYVSREEFEAACCEAQAMAGERLAEREVDRAETVRYLGLYSEYAYADAEDALSLVLVRNEDDGPLPLAEVMYRVARDHVEADMEWAMEHFFERMGL